MAKTRRSKPRPRYGLTVAQERHNAEVADLKNQVYGRDCELENLRELIKIERARTAQLHDRLDLLTDPPIKAINEVCTLSVAEAERIGLVEPIARLAGYGAQLKAAHGVLVASGNKVPT